MEKKFNKKNILFLNVLIILVLIINLQSISALTVSDCHTKATGGNITINGNYCVHTFLTNGSFNLTSNLTNVKILVVAGGGQGGSAYGGGAGAGGLIYLTNYSINSGNHSVVVGLGGSGAGTFSTGNNGGNSTFINLNAMGGGGGGGANGNNGGSGGGAGNGGTHGLGYPGQGNVGGGDANWGNGGGGASEAGYNSTVPSGVLGGNGGNGTLIDINGTSVYYAGGGGGASSSGVGNSYGGAGGGGRGDNGDTPPTEGNDAINGTGGGGGGRGGSNSGGLGGSGIIIISYQYEQSPETNLTVNLISPLNNSNTTNTNINFTWNLTSGVGLKNSTIYIFNSSDNLVNQTTITSFDNNQTTIVSQVISLLVGAYKWSVDVFDINNSNKTSQNNTFEITPLISNISLIYPPNGSYINISNINFTANITSSNNLTNATLYILTPTNYCYQESTNTTNQTGIDGSCGLNYTGSYSFSGAWGNHIPPYSPVNYYKLYDGDWTSFLYGGYNSDAYLYINYTKPNNASFSGSWQVKDLNNTKNITILSSCFNQEILQLSLMARYGNNPNSGVINYTCYDGNTWQQLYYATEAGNGGFFEEAMIWTIPYYINTTTYNQSPGILETVLLIPITLVKGSYSWFVKTFDVLGNSLTSNINSFTLNLTLPIPNVSIVYPLPINYSNQVSSLNYTFNDSEFCWYSITPPSLSCYQETANISTNCGGLNTGEYDSNVSFNGTWVNYKNVFDGIWGSEGHCASGGLCEIYINYTIPVNAVGATFYYTTESAAVQTANLSSYDCFNKSFGKVMIKGGSDDFGPEMSWSCSKDGGLTFDTIYVIGINNLLYEEAINWTMDTITSSPVTAGENFTINATEGNNNWTVYCNNSDGSIGFDSVEFFQDSLYPIINILYPLNITYYTNVSILNYTQFDISPGYCWYDANGYISEPVTAGDIFYNVPSQDGGNNWTVYCNDTGNLIGSSTVSFTRNPPIPPQIAFIPPTLPTGTNASQTFITAVVDVNETNEANITFYFENPLLLPYECYQESVNTTNQTGIDGSCGLNYTGKYSVDGSGYYYINYTKPYSFIGGLWNIKHGIDTYPLEINENITIPNECLNAYNDKLSFRVYARANTDIFHYNQAYCNNGTDWVQLYIYGSTCIPVTPTEANWTDSIDGNWSTGSFSTTTSSTGYRFFEGASCPATATFFEEAMIWNITPSHSFTGVGIRNYTLTNLSDGLYNYNVTICNTFNLCNSTETRTITLDTINPNITIIAPLNNSYSNQSIINFTWVINDSNMIYFSGTGGTITYDGDYIIHTFLTNDTFSIPGNINAEVLVVAGGGQGGSAYAGGGGAGGLIYVSNYLINAGNYSVIIGEGGSGAGTFTTGNNGGNSTFIDLNAMGGGGGGGSGNNAGNGGSGGGAGNGGTEGSGYGSQGYRGGMYNTDGFWGNGGGGAGEIGYNSTAGTYGGAGGNGLAFTIYNGTSIYYAGGGGGASSNGFGNSLGGLGGGGQGDDSDTGATGGIDGLGGGGGGRGGSNGGGAGGSGIVIIRYLNQQQLSTGIQNSTLYIYNSTDNVLVNQTTFTSFSDIFNTIISVPVTLVDGVYTWFADAFDFAGNRGTTTNITFTLDTIYPLINFTSPTTSAGGPYNISSIEANATAIDSNLNNITINLTLISGGVSYSNQQVLTGINTTTASLYYNWTGLGQGIYNLTTWAYDKVNFVTYESRSINIDPEPPVMNYVNPTPIDGKYTADTYFTINVTANDTNFANQTIYYWYENATVQRQTTVSNINTLAQTSLLDGTYYYNASGIDILRQITWLPTRNITIEYYNRNVSACKELFVEGGNYQVFADLTASNGTCLIISADNINLNCNGYLINGNGWDAISISSGITGVTLINCTATASGKNALKVGESPASVTVYDSTFTGSNYGINVAPEANLYAYNVTITNNVYGIYFNNSNNQNILNNITFSGNSEDALTLINTNNNYLTRINLISTSDTSNDGVIVLNRSSNNNFTNSIYVSSPSKLFAFYNYSINNYLYSVSYYSVSQDYIDGTSQLIRAWPFTGYVIDSVKTKIGGAQIIYTASNPTNQNTSYGPTYNYTYVNCYQESPTVANQSGIDGNCSLNYSGSADITPPYWQDINGNNITGNITYDGNWSTYAFGQYFVPGSTVTSWTRQVYITPINATGASWVFKTGNINNPINITVDIPSNCIWNNSIIVDISSTSYYGIGGATNYTNSSFYCLTNFGIPYFASLYNDTGNPTSVIYEDAIMWNITTSVTPIPGPPIVYETLRGVAITNDQGIAYAPIIQYMNIRGTQYDSSPYYMNASYLGMAPTNALITIENATSYTFALKQEWKSTSLSRTAMWIILGIIFLIGIAASIGFFMVRMREGYSVVDIWKYFIILVIWLTMFTIIYFVLAWFIMGSFYPQV